MLASSANPSNAVTDSPVDVSEVFVETYLRSVLEDHVEVGDLHVGA